MPHIRRRSKRPSIAQVTSVPEAEELLVQDEDKIHVPRATKDPWWISALEVACVILLMFMLWFCWRHEDLVHLHTAKVYAHLGHASAQHVLAHRYLNGSGVEKDHAEAMRWFRKSADQGHAHSAYNLAVGHMQGLETDVQKGEAKKLIKHAMNHGVHEAHHIYHTVCITGQKCDH
ncbi:uncharacterized protein LOC111270640 isoform X2 [Varroa jacobsoni]|uniref:Uncharacterized protein n=1 Tax=Varroa destructor TaxID=109461 RepID=A0A7M7J9K1_VARDE|nr:uncharacterized protein LOC111245094 isoform X2 [Varroa destructor]XP_022706719.1 uncharacterized protein LOC111270640 isoform X2 [Varroa jacobsoni]